MKFKAAVIAPGSVEQGDGNLIVVDEANQIKPPTGTCSNQEILLGSVEWRGMLEVGM